MVVDDEAVPIGAGVTPLEGHASDLPIHGEDHVPRVRVPQGGLEVQVEPCWRFAVDSGAIEFDLLWGIIELPHGCNRNSMGTGATAQEMTKVRAEPLKRSTGAT